MAGFTATNMPSNTPVQLPKGGTPAPFGGQQAGPVSAAVSARMAGTKSATAGRQKGGPKSNFGRLAGALAAARTNVARTSGPNRTNPVQAARNRGRNWTV